MTLAITTPQVTYDTDGATLAFDFSFKMWQATVDDEIAVVFQEGEDDEATLALTTDYTLSAPNNDYSSGGTVTLVTDSVYAATGNTITIKSDLLRSQEYDLQHGGALNTESLETVLDRYVRMIQEAELQGTIEQTAITAFMKTLLTKTTAALGRDALGIYTDAVELTNTELKALNATPKELVAAQGADKFIEFVSALLVLDYGTNVLTESADNLDIEYDDGTGPAVCATIECTDFIDQAADQVMLAAPVVIAGSTTAASTVNKNLALLSNEGDFAGNAADDTTMTVIVRYRIHTLGLA